MFVCRYLPKDLPRLVWIYYIIEFEYTSKKIVFNVDITSYVNVPICGQVKPVIKMEYDLEIEKYVGDYTTKLFSKEQTYKSMLKILGY